jgi:uncharacterized protein (DUF488 family)
VGVEAVPTIVSIGYEGRAIEELVADLAVRHVSLVADVRLNAISRKSRFSKRALGLLAELTEHNTLAVVCFESDHDTCHRALVMDAVTARQPGLTVLRG